MIIRPAREADLEATFDLFLAAANDLRTRSGRAPIADTPARRARALAFRRHALATDPEGYWVADAAGALAGFGIATRRGRLWYLAALHVAPAWQGHGLGGRLLRHCLATAEGAGTIRTTISEASQPVSNALYARHGLFQWIPLLHLAGPPAGIDADPAAGEIEWAADAAALADLTALDEAVLGLARAVDHRFWLAQADLGCLLVRRGGTLAGYAYVSRAGGIGPVAARSPRLLPVVLAAALGAATAQGADACWVRIPGTCRPAVAFLLERGFRIEADVDLLLASRPFGRFDRYLVSAGDALL